MSRALVALRPRASRNRWFENVPRSPQAAITTALRTHSGSTKKREPQVWAHSGDNVLMIDKSKMYDALDMIAKGITRPTRIAAAMGISYRSYCGWMTRSNAGDPKFLITFNDEEMQFAKAISLATKLALFELRNMLLTESVMGYPEQQVFQGNVVWAPCPVASATAPELREMLGYRADGLLTDERGALVPLVIQRKAPFAQSIRLLEAAFIDLRPSQTMNVNQNINGQIGVAFAPRVDYSKGAPPVPAPPPIPQLEAPIVDADFEEILGPVPVPVAPVNISFDVTLTEPEPADDDLQPTEVSGKSPPMITTDRQYSDAPSAREASPRQGGILKPPGLAFDAPPPRPARTPLEQSLFDELAKAREKKAAQP